MTLSWYVGTANESIFANKQKTLKKDKKSWFSFKKKNKQQQTQTSSKMGNSPVKPGMHHPENVYRTVLNFKMLISCVIIFICLFSTVFITKVALEGSECKIMSKTGGMDIIKQCNATKIEKN